MAKKGDKKKATQRPADPHPHVHADRTASAIVLAATAVRLAFWLVLAVLVLDRVPPILEAVAGTQTVFDFSLTASASLSISVVTSGAAVGLYFRNRQLTRRLREMEGRHPPASPQAEQLPLPGDGGPQ